MTAPAVMTKGSLCSGYGGLDMALPGELAWTSEIDPGACAVLTHEHPGVLNLGDLTTRTWSRARTVGLLTAGFPCQPVSEAGPQLGESDPRWLWPGVLAVIEATRPAEVFLENVRNIVSIHGGVLLKQILTDLHAARYDCRWTVLGACAIGAPHHRHRWFLRAVRTRGKGLDPVRLLNKCGAPRTGGRVLLPTPTTADGSGGPGTSTRRTGGMNLRSAVQLLPTPTVRDSDGRGEGDERYWTARAEHRSNGMPLGAAVALLPTPRATDGTNGGPNQGIASGDIALSSACQPQRFGKYAEAVALWESITGREAPEPTVQAPKGGRRLNPRFSEWMMGLTPGLVTDVVDRSAALRIIGNGVVPAQAAAAFAMLGAEK